MTLYVFVFFAKIQKKYEMTKKTRHDTKYFLNIRFIRNHASMKIPIINSLNTLDSFFNANYH